MKRQMKKTAALLLAALLLGTGTAVLLNADKGGGVSAALMAEGEAAEEDTAEKTEQESKEGTALISRAAQDGGGQVERILMHNASGACSLVRREETFALEGAHGERADPERVEEAVEAVCTVRAEKSLGKQTDTAAFGFTEEAVEVTLVLADGSREVFRIGNTLPGDQERCYVEYQGEIYVTPAFPGSVSADETALYQMVLIDIGGADQETLGYLRLSGENFPQPVELRADDAAVSGYRMEKPVRAEALLGENYAGTEEKTLIEALTHLEAEALYCENAGEEQLEACGLARPYARAEYILGGESHTLAVSERKTDGTRYLTVDGAGDIYLAADEAVRVWAESSAMDYRSSYLCLIRLDELDRLTLIRGQERDVYEIGQNPAGERTVLLNGQALDMEETFKPFYEKLLGMSVLSLEEPEALEPEAELTVLYEYTQNGVKKEAEAALYRAAEGNRFAAVLDGAYAGTLRSSTVEEIVEMAERVKRNEKLG